MIRTIGLNHARLTLWLIGLLCAPPALAADPVGYVASIDGKALIIRDGKERDLQLGEFIQQGDIVQASPPHTVRVDTRSGPVAVCIQKTPLDCRWLATAPSLNPVADWWNRSVAMAGWVKSSPRNLVTRAGLPPKFPVSAGVPQRLVAGRRTLHVPVSDGSPPFKAKLVQADREVAEITSRDHVLRFPTVEFLGGAVDLVVEDDAKSVARLQIIVMTASSSMPDLSTSAVNDDHRLLLEAGWLMIQSAGAWRLEAFQRLDSVADRSPVAELMRRGLAAGQRP